MQIFLFFQLLLVYAVWPSLAHAYGELRWAPRQAAAAKSSLVLPVCRSSKGVACPATHTVLSLPGHVCHAYTGTAGRPPAVLQRPTVQRSRCSSEHCLKELAAAAAAGHVVGRCMPAFKSASGTAKVLQMPRCCHSNQLGAEMCMTLTEPSPHPCAPAACPRPSA